MFENTVQTCELEVSKQSDYAALECNLAKCLVLCAFLCSHKLIDSKESNEVKSFLLSVDDQSKLNFLVRSFENTQCLFKFRKNLAGFMGAPFLGLLRPLRFQPSQSSLLISEEDSSASNFSSCNIDGLRKRGSLSLCRLKKWHTATKLGTKVCSSPMLNFSNQLSKLRIENLAIFSINSPLVKSPQPKRNLLMASSDATNQVW